MIKFIHSTGIDIMEIEPEWLDPTSEQEFQIMLEQINTKNKNRDKFPIRLNWTDYIPYLLKKRVSESLNILRMERNKILQSTDWVLTHDNALSLLNLDDWIQYRKNLRDFFESPFQIIFKEDTNELDRDAMKFPPVQPPILRK